MTDKKAGWRPTNIPETVGLGVDNMISINPKYSKTSVQGYVTQATIEKLQRDKEEMYRELQIDKALKLGKKPASSSSASSPEETA